MSRYKQFDASGKMQFSAFSSNRISVFSSQLDGGIEQSDTI